jgi:hypothetical protein
MSKTGLWPREKPRPTDSHAELKVYDALRQQLPGNWTAWHPLRIRNISPYIPFSHTTSRHNRFIGLESGADYVRAAGISTVEQGFWLGPPMRPWTRDQGLAADQVFIGGDVV